MTGPLNETSGTPHPPDWTASHQLLQQEIRTEMQRLVKDEQWLAETDRRTRIGWGMALAALVLGVLAITAIVLSVVAMNRNIDSVSKTGPKNNTVGAGAIKDGAVGPSKLAPTAVGTAAIADRAVTVGKIAPGAIDTAALGAKAVTGAKVADNALTGTQINEATLGPVRAAGNAVKLAGLPVGSFLTDVSVVQVQTVQSTSAVKGPQTALCPSGSSVIGGGAEVVGATNVALVQSAAVGRTGWIATARRQNNARITSWKLVVQAICGTWGKG